MRHSDSSFLFICVEKSVYLFTKKQEMKLMKRVQQQPLPENIFFAKFEEFKTLDQIRNFSSEQRVGQVC